MKNRFHKLIVQIPCFNEGEQIAACLQALPKTMEGFDVVETMVIDDGSTDDTVERAQVAGATHLFKIGHHVGLAKVFGLGLDQCFARGADVVVNFDADLQYLSSDLKRLVDPLLQGQADYVVGQRDIMANPHFSLTKKWLQRMGTTVIRLLAGVDVLDATSGFRAITREAGLRLSVWTQYSYTLETLFQASELGLRVANVPIGVSPVTRRTSRLLRSNWHYCWQSFKTMLITIVRYRPFAVFISLSAFSMTVAFLIGARFLYYFLHGDHGKVQSLILCAIMAMAGLSFFLVSVLAETASLNRRLLEEIRYTLRSRTGISGE